MDNVGPHYAFDESRFREELARAHRITGGAAEAMFARAVKLASAKEDT